MTDLVQEVEEARPDDEDRQEEHVQPEDEAVLRLPRDVRARPGWYRRSYLQEAGVSLNSWEDLRKGAAKLKALGHPVGLGMSPEIDSNMLLVAPLLLRRLHPERGEPHRHRTGRQPERGDSGAAGHARHLPHGHVGRGLRVERIVEQQRVRRRPALRGAERDLDRPHREDSGNQALRTTRGSPPSRAVP